MPAVGNAYPDLLEALAAFVAGTGVVPGAGGVTTDEASDGTPSPYIVITEADEHTTYDSPEADGTVQWTAELTERVTIYADSKAIARGILRQLRPLLVDPPVVYSSGSLIYCRPVDRTDEKDPDLGVDGSDVWAETLHLRVILEGSTAGA